MWCKTLCFALSLAVAGSAQSAGPESPVVTVLLANDAQVVRREVVRVSIPFGRGVVKNMAGLIVKGAPRTAWRTLCRWPDGSVRVAQAQFPLELKPRQIVNLPVIKGKDARGSFTPDPRWRGRAPAGSMGLVSRVTDRFGVEYTCVPGGKGEVLEETPLVRTTRYRGYHRCPRPGKGIGRDLLSLTAYVTEFATSPVLAYDLVLGNDYLGSDAGGDAGDPNLHALGDVWLKRYQLSTATHELIFRHPRRSGVESPHAAKGGGRVWPLLRETYLADGQCRRWRFYLLPKLNGVPPLEAGVHRRTWQTMATLPLRPLADAWSWLRSGALSLYGGPAFPPQDWARRVGGALARWNARDHFGPFGSWGDVKESGTTGTPRNGPVSSSWAWAVQTSRGRLLDILEGKAWQQACRPYHMWGLKVEPGDDLYLWTGLPYGVFGGRHISGRNLGRKRLHDQDPWRKWRGIDKHPWPGPHGWNGYDNEHWTTDLIFDCWLATGDWWCRDELRLLGECAMGLLRPTKYPTRWPQAARCEGWMAQSLVQVWLATGDKRIADFVRHRIKHILVPAIKRDKPWRTPFVQGDYAGTGYPKGHRFYMPWQHGPLILGMLAAYDLLGEKSALELCDAAARAVEYGRVRGVKDPKFGKVAQGLRFYVPVAVNGKGVPAHAFDKAPGIKFGDSPLGGAHRFLTLPLHLLARTEAATPASRRIAEELGAILRKAHRDNPTGHWDKWTALIPD